MPSEHENWMSPLNRIIWFNAFRKKATTVTTRDGRRFSVDYNKQTGKAWVTPERDIIPCGWFDLERVTSEEFLAEQAGKQRVGADAS